MQCKHPLILASSSPRRKDLLVQIGIYPNLIVPADIDETPHKGELPAPYVKRMAQEKAEKIAKLHPDAIILAADTIVVTGRSILPKAEDEATARDCLKRLSGRRHRTMTAFAIIRPDTSMVLKCVETTVKFARLSETEIDTYIASDEWRGKAGGYAIQGSAQSFIERINGSFTTVVGLPLAEVKRSLNYR